MCPGLRFGNVGDEIILHNLIRWLDDTGRCKGIVVLSSDPLQTARRLGVRSVHSFNPIGVIRELSRSDLLISGGGTLIQDRTSLRSALYYLAVLAAALALRRRVAIVGQGLGPMHTRIVKALTRLLLSRADLIALRDRGSADLLKDLGVPVSRVRIGADLAFLSTALRDKRAESEAAERGRWHWWHSQEQGLGPRWTSSLALRMAEASLAEECRVLAFQPADAMPRYPAACASVVQPPRPMRS